MRKPYEPLPKDINAAFLKSSISGNYSGAPAGPTPSKEMTKNANYLEDSHQEQMNRMKQEKVKIILNKRDNYICQ